MDKNSKNKDFELIETLLWEEGDFFLLDLHMKRLEESASFFSFEYDLGSITDSLLAISSSLDVSTKYKVRLLLKKTGEFEITSSPLEEPEEKTLKVKVSSRKTSRDDVLLFHKTTNREIYISEYEKFSRKGFFDVVFTNAEGEITEGAITNIIVRKNDEYLTPPVSSGLLAGTYREYLLSSQEIPLKEKVLYEEDLLNADEIFVVNSVRKLVKVELEK